MNFISKRKSPAESVKDWNLTHTRKKIHSPTTFSFSGWRVKIYYIGDKINKRFLNIAEIISEQTLPSESITQERYGLAFIIIHPAALFNQITIDWWERTNELRHQVFKSGQPDIFDFENITATGESFCVWELAILAFERDLWLSKILEIKPPDFDTYFKITLNTII